jgi:hypothetical protein
MTMTPQQLLYEAVKDRLPPYIGFDQYLSFLNDWEIIPIHEGTELIGTATRQGTELHVAFIKQGNCIRRAIRETIGKILKEHGEVTTVVPLTNHKGLTFCKRLGFEVEDERDGVVYMKLVRCRYV